MSSPHDMTEDRIQQMLAEAAEMDLAYARHVQGLALASDDPAVVAELGKTRARVTRSMRQNLALLSKLRREAAEAARCAAPAAGVSRDADGEDDEDEPPRRLFPRDIRAARVREDELRTAGRRLIWSEGFETSDYEDERDLEGEFYRSLEDWVVEARLDEDFTDRPLDDLVAEFAEAMGLNPAAAARWRDLPDPPPERMSDSLDDDSG